LCGFQSDFLSGGAACGVDFLIRAI
jgi:hypothetical protein